MNVYVFPTSVDRTKIHSLIRLNACGHISRMKADDAISRILVSYGISHLHIEGYMVHLGDSICTVLGNFPVIHIEAHREAPGPNCPDCGGKPGYLEGEEAITAGCQSCGMVYKFREVGTCEKPC